jgi:hypothetical protein
VQKLLAGGRRLWRSTGLASGWTALAVGLASGFPVAAQEPDGTIQTNDLMTAEVLARISELIQSAESTQPEEMASPNDLIGTNGVPHAENGSAKGGGRAEQASRAENPSRSESGNRVQGSSRSRGRRSYRPASDPKGRPGSASYDSRGSDRAQTNAPAGTNGSPASLDYSAFRIIVDRNIFDPNRYPRRPGEPRVRPNPKPAEWLTLVGTMSYERGSFAFFDGTSADYKKALKLSDAIAGYKVTSIAPHSVKLAAGTNEQELRVGAQIRREEDGPWLPAGQAQSPAAMTLSTATNSAATATAAVAAGPDASPGEPESEIIKRLRQKREQE